MLLSTWIQTVRSRQWKWPGRSPYGRIAGRPHRFVRLQIEWLEARTLLSPIVTITILPNPISILPNPGLISIFPTPVPTLPNLISISPSLIPGVPNPISVLPSPVPILPNLPPVLNLPPVQLPASQPPTSNANTATPLLGSNFQNYSGFSTPNQIYFSSGSSRGYAPIGGSSEAIPSSAKASEDVAFLSGIGDEDQETTLDFPVQLTMTSDDEALSTSDIAAALLIGVRPKLVPQKGSHVAPVATLLADDSGEEIKPITDTEEESPLRHSLISPLGQLHMSSFQSSLHRRLGEELAATDLNKEDKAQSSKFLLGLSPLAVIAGGLVALWGIQEYRSAGRKPRLNQ